jgi:hypothetical protein
MKQKIYIEASRQTQLSRQQNALYDNAHEVRQALGEAMADVKRIMVVSDETRTYLYASIMMLRVQLDEIEAEFV